MYLLPKIHKRLVNAPGRPVISNCGTPTEKASEFLDHHLQAIVRSGLSYIKATNYFLQKLKNLKKVPDNAVLVNADAVGLYPSIPHNEGLEVLKKQLNNFYEKSILTEDLVKMVEFALKNNYFEFNSNVKHKISGTAIGTKFTPPYACVYIWTTWRISFSKLNKFSLGFGSGTLIFFSLRQPVKKNLMIFWSDSIIFILI